MAVNAAASLPGELRDQLEGGILLVLEPAPPPWRGPVVELASAGPLCTERPPALAIWTPYASWPRAFGLLAMFKSARPQDCLVLTDRLPPLELVPGDGLVAAVDEAGVGPAHAGAAAFSAAELRSERLFRLLLEGRARRRPELRPLLDLHLLARTAHGRRVLDAWSDVLPVLFAGGLPGMMPEELRADLEELKQGALACEHAITGGFHALDPVVRGPADWEAGTARYLSLAASLSPPAAAEVARWLAAHAGWERLPEGRAEELRRMAARALHRLVDDPWPAEREVAGLFEWHP